MPAPLTFAAVRLVLAGAGLFAAHDLALGVHARGDGLVLDGDVETAGKLMGGEGGCNPTSAGASLIVDAEGELTVQRP